MCRSVNVDHNQKTIGFHAPETFSFIIFISLHFILRTNVRSLRKISIADREYFARTSHVLSLAPSGEKSLATALLCVSVRSTWHVRPSQTSPHAHERKTVRLPRVRVPIQAGLHRAESHEEPAPDYLHQVAEDQIRWCFCRLKFKNYMFKCINNTECFFKNIRQPELLEN